MRNTLLHLLFLAAPFLVAELGSHVSSHASRLSAPAAASACDSTASEAPATARKPTPAPTAPATPAPSVPNTAVRAPRRPLPAHLFM